MRLDLVCLMFQPTKTCFMSKNEKTNTKIIISVLPKCTYLSSGDIKHICSCLALLIDVAF